LPRYDYKCSEEHMFEAVGSYEDDTIPCQAVCGIPDFEGDDYPVTLHCCGLPAKRVPVYRDQYVSFKGDGFTKTVYVPNPPDPKSTAGLKTDEAVEVWDDIAKESHEYNKNTRPYLYEEGRKEVKEAGLDVNRAAEDRAKGKRPSEDTKKKTRNARGRRAARQKG